MDVRASGFVASGAAVPIDLASRQNHEARDGAQNAGDGSGKPPDTPIRRTHGVVGDGLRGALVAKDEAGRGPMQKLQSQGVHHITLVGAGRQTSIDFWEGVLGMPSSSSSPTSTSPGKAISISIRATEG